MPSLLAGAAVTVFGIVAAVLVVTALLLWHNYRCGLWCINVGSRAPAWLRRCCAARQARASKRAPAECAPAPPAPTAWEVHYNEAYAAPKGCAAPERFDEEGDADSDAGGARLREAERGDALGPLPAPRASATRAARHSGSRGARIAAVGAALQAAQPPGALRCDGYAPN